MCFGAFKFVNIAGLKKCYSLFKAHEAKTWTVNKKLLVEIRRKSAQIGTFY